MSDCVTQSDTTHQQTAASEGSSNMTTQSQPSTSQGYSHANILRKRAKTTDPRADEAYRILKDTYESKIRDKSQAFGNHVASKHREYSKRTKAYVEHYINNILFDADMGKYDYEQSFASTPTYSYSDSSQNTLPNSVTTDQPPSNQITTIALENNSQNTINTGQQLHIPNSNDTETAETEETSPLAYFINNFK